MNKKERFFKQLTQNFEGKKVESIFLRGHEFIKNNEDCGEIDILVKKFDLKKVREIFRQVPACYQFKNNIDLTHLFLIKVVRNNFIVYLDFQIKGIGYCGSTLLKEDYLFSHIKQQGFYNVLNDEAKFLMLFVHGFIFRKKLTYFKKYEEEFFRLYSSIKKDRISKELSQIFDSKTSEKIISLIEKRNLKELFKLRKSLIMLNLIKRPLEIYRIMISKLMRFRNYFGLNRIFYILNPFKWAPLICFIGSDGSGKSTMVNESKEYLNRFGIKNISISGGVFSGIKSPFNKKRIIKDYSERVFNPLEKNIKLLARILFQIPKQIKIAYYRKKGLFVISDRYSYDTIFFYGGGSFFKHLVKIISQKPTKCFYLKAKPKEIYKRNKELSLNTISRVSSRIDANKSYFKLVELKNENLKEAKLNLKNYLEKIVKNV